MAFIKNAVGSTHGRGYAHCSGAQISQSTQNLHSLPLRSVAVVAPFSSRQGRKSSRGPTSSSVLASERPPPWTAIFDLRERETDWTEGNQARLVSLFASYELDCSVEGIQERLQQLLQVLPDLERRVHLMKPPLLAELLRDTAAVAERAVQLKQLLPRINVSAMASKQPEILLQEADAVAGQVDGLKQQLGSNKVDQIVEDYPSLLDAELVQEVLDELHRLMPKSDPKQILLRDPSYISKVERGTKRLGPHPDTM